MNDSERSLDRLEREDSFFDDRVPSELVGEPNYKGVPKRYEDTKPFDIQKLSHANILKLGAQYHQQLLEKLEKEKEEAVKEAIEKAEREAAEKLKLEVERLHEYANSDKERALNQQQALHHQQLTEEKMKIESQMNRFWQVKMEEAIEEKDLEMRRAVERTRTACYADLEERIKKAKAEERKKALEEQERERKANEEKMKKEREVAMKDKESAMKKMRELLEGEKDAAVAAAKIQEQNMAASELATIISAQTEKLMELEKVIGCKDESIVSKQETINELEKLRLKLLTDVNDQKLRLQYFVDTVRHFTPGENDHLIDKRGVHNYIPDVTPIIEGTDF